MQSARPSHASKSKLNAINILIADPDERITKVLADTLKAMGFGKVVEVRNGDAALALLAKENFDLLITDWQMRPTDGITLIGHLRRAPDSPNRTLPIIMLTGRAEAVDVEAARDNGVTEFIVKPFTARSIYKRIEQIIDRPRGFVIAPGFIGHDRRRKEAEPNPERRKKAPQPLLSAPNYFAKEHYISKIIAPDYSVKKKLGHAGDLSLLINESVLEIAQQTIDNLKTDSLKWVQDDLNELERLYEKIVREPKDETHEAMLELLISIKSNTGTFGYHIASSVAQQLYKFMRMNYQGGNEQHRIIIEKHIQSLKVILANALTGGKSHFGEDLLSGLSLMISKFWRP